MSNFYTYKFNGLLIEFVVWYLETIKMHIVQLIHLMGKYAPNLVVQWWFSLQRHIVHAQNGMFWKQIHVHLEWFERCGTNFIVGNIVQLPYTNIFCVKKRIEQKNRMWNEMVSKLTQLMHKIVKMCAFFSSLSIEQLSHKRVLEHFFFSCISLLFFFSGSMWGQFFFVLAKYCFCNQCQLPRNHWDVYDVFTGHNLFYVSVL